MGVHDKSVFPQIRELLGIPDGEPIFVLRAQDRLYCPTLAAYEALYMTHARAAKTLTAAELTENEWEFADEIDNERESGRRWQRNDRNKVKTPD